jgi:hypothetical protein
LVDEPLEAVQGRDRGGAVVMNQRAGVRPNAQRRQPPEPDAGHVRAEPLLGLELWRGQGADQPNAQHVQGFAASVGRGQFEQRKHLVARADARRKAALDLGAHGDRAQSPTRGGMRMSARQRAGSSEQDFPNIEDGILPRGRALATLTQTMARRD